MASVSQPDIEVRYATEDDVASLGSINRLSFASGLLLRNIFPAADASALTNFKSVLALKHLNNPEMHVLVAVHRHTNDILAYCRWVIPRGLGYDRESQGLSEHGVAAAADPMRFAPEGMNIGVHAAFKQLLEEGRAKYVTDRDLVLDFLATTPAQQGKGIGSMCLNWGLEKADALKARVYLEATPKGYGLYRRYGWEPLEESTLDCGQHGGEGNETLVLMMRERQ